MFGYMFADVGQGFVLLIAGYLLRSRWDGARLIMVAGISAMLFGFLFGSVFSYEELLPALLFHPLHDPLLTLVLPIAFGAMLLTLGQLLEGLEFWWRGELRAWWLKKSGLLLLYLGGVLGLMQHELGLIALLGVIWFLVGNTLAGGHWYTVFVALGKLLEDAMRLLVNTVSFARVGAFALAHAGLSSAIVALANSTQSVVGTLLIVLAGNVLIIVLEGLVVSIQTTRLVLFEFFVRFFQGSGRPFRPLALPPEVANVPPSNV
jgi:V/A-type H+-transporting ATPase subunit I